MLVTAHNQFLSEQELPTNKAQIMVAFSVEAREELIADANV